jgi:hypothetical protein
MNRFHIRTVSKKISSEFFRFRIYSNLKFVHIRISFRFKFVQFRIFQILIWISFGLQRTMGSYISYMTALNEGVLIGLRVLRVWPGRGDTGGVLSRLCRGSQTPRAMKLISPISPCTSAVACPLRHREVIAPTSAFSPYITSAMNTHGRKQPRGKKTPQKKPPWKKPRREAKSSTSIKHVRSLRLILCLSRSVFFEGVH